LKFKTNASNVKVNVNLCHKSQSWHLTTSAPIVQRDGFENDHIFCPN